MRFLQNNVLRQAFLLCCCEIFLLKKHNIMASNRNIMQGSKPVKCESFFSSSVYYKNPWDTWNFKMVQSALTLSYTRIRNDTSAIPSDKDLDETLPIVRYDDCDHKTAKQNMHKDFEGTWNGVKFMWIGHASCMVKVDGVTLLADPMFSKWCSPIAHTGPLRYRDAPCTIHDLPHNIDAVVISHDHYDHLDKYSVQELHKKYGQKLHWFVPKGMEPWIKGRTSADAHITELSWWEEYMLNGVKFVFTPTQHWCGRKPPIDTNTMLWGSWSIIGKKHKFFFGGDTGYCEAFKEIGEILGPFDLAAIPIGAYTPNEVLKCQHVHPEESIQIHKDIRSKESIGIHWGTFKMTYEPYLEPKQLIEKLTKEDENKGVIFYTIKHGEIIESGKYKSVSDTKIETAIDAAKEIEFTSEAMVSGDISSNVVESTENDKEAVNRKSETGSSLSSQWEVISSPGTTAEDLDKINKDSFQAIHRNEVKSSVERIENNSTSFTDTAKNKTESSKDITESEIASCTTAQSYSQEPVDNSHDNSKRTDLSEEYEMVSYNATDENKKQPYNKNMDSSKDITENVDSPKNETKQESSNMDSDINKVSSEAVSESKTVTQTSKYI